MCKTVNHLLYRKCALLFLYLHVIFHLMDQSQRYSLCMDQHKLPMRICYSLIRYYWLTGLLRRCWIMSVIVFCRIRAHSHQPPQWASFITHEQNEFVCKLLMQPFLRKLLHWIAFDNLRKNSFNSVEKYSNSEAATDWWTYEWKCVSIIFHHSNVLLSPHTCTHGLCRSGRQFPLSSFHSLLKTRCIEHAWHLKNPWLLFASVPPFRFVFPLKIWQIWSVHEKHK